MPISTRTLHATPLASPREQCARGFTIIELIAVITIVGIIAAIAVPRYIALGRQARVATVNTMASAIQSTAINVRVMCKINPACDYNNQDLVVQIGGRNAELSYGWLVAGYTLSSQRLDGWVSYAGFTANLPAGGETTLFTLDGSSDPQNCSVSYRDTYSLGPAASPPIVVLTTGC